MLREVDNNIIKPMNIDKYPSGVLHSKHSSLQRVTTSYLEKPCSIIPSQHSIIETLHSSIPSTEQDKNIRCQIFRKFPTDLWHPYVNLGARPQSASLTQRYSPPPTNPPQQFRCPLPYQTIKSLPQHRTHADPKSHSDTTPHRHSPQALRQSSGEQASHASHPP